jgi:hypothetical protein
MALQPDLIPQSVSLSNSSLKAGGSETVTMVVKNQGKATAPCPCHHHHHHHHDPAELGIPTT